MDFKSLQNYVLKNIAKLANCKKGLPGFLGKLIHELRKSKSAEQHSACTQDTLYHYI
jgi:hypothetical protein